MTSNIGFVTMLADLCLSLIFISVLLMHNNELDNSIALSPES